METINEYPFSFKRDSPIHVQFRLVKRQKLPDHAYISKLYLLENEIDTAFDIFKRLTALKKFRGVLGSQEHFAVRQSQEQFQVSTVQEKKRIKQIYELYKLFADTEKANTFEYQMIKLQLQGHRLSYDELLAIYQQYKANSRPLFFAILNVLQNDPAVALQFIDYCEKDGLLFDTNIYTAIMKVLVDDYPYLSIKYFQKIETPDDISVSVLIKAWSNLGKPERGFQIIKEYELQTPPSLMIYTSLLSGFAGGYNKYDLESIFNLILAKGLIPDLAVYNVMIRGYCKRNDLPNVLKYVLQVEKYFIPDRYLYATLTPFVAALPSSSVLYRWYVDRFQRQPSVSTFHYDEFVEISGEKFKNQMKRPFTLKGMFYLAHRYLPRQKLPYKFLLKASLRKPQFGKILEQYQKKFKLDADVYSLLILQCYGKRPNAENAWKLFYQMKEDKIIPTPLVYRNLLLICRRTNDIDSCRKIIDEIIENEIVMERGMVSNIIDMLLRNHKSQPTLWQVIKQRSISPTDSSKFDSSFSRMNSQEQRAISNPPSTVLIESAIKFIEYQQAINNEAVGISGRQLNRLIRNVLVLEDPSVYIAKIHSWITKAKDEQLVSALEHQLMKSHLWDLAEKYVDLETKKKHVIELAQNREVSQLYTMFKLSPDPIISSMIIEQLGVYIKDEKLTRLVYAEAKKTSEIVWSFIRSLVWWGYLEDAVQVSTSGLQIDDKTVPVKLGRWLKLKGLTDLENHLVEYWKEKRPDWQLEKDI
ncbi:hypothetical protein HK103_005124 [Boothiomyces macroporosus]|uniref:Uncharacterized protein n=1 Tax=Boothiomyces macroporosus TaxID=261099 RepID=A0AAD5UFK3_9FUNG|nr:hypothetical protein HK103_005124 [Boothiomyces macroporosus]